MRNNYSKRKFFLKLTGLLLSLLLLGGCWSSHETNNLAIINALGIDRGKDGNYIVTMITIRPEALFSINKSGSNTVGTNTETPQLMTTASGVTLYDAIQKIANSVPKRLIWTTMDFVVFGEDIAREGLEPVLDMMIRGAEFRPNNKFLVTKGSAHEIMKQKPQLENTFGAELFNLKEYARLNTTPYVADLVEFSDAIVNDTNDPLTAQLSVAPAYGTENKEIGLEKQGRDSLGLNLSGLAVFKKDQLVGWLNNKEARGISLLRGDEHTGISIIPCPENVGKISIEITDSNSQLKPKIVNGKQQMDVNLNIDATLREITCPNIDLDVEQFDKLNQLLEQEITQQITSALNKAQKEWQADIVGFGEAFYKKYPQAWKQLAPTWSDGGLKDLEVNLNIRANIYRFGLFYDPISTKGSR